MFKEHIEALFLWNKYEFSRFVRRGRVYIWCTFPCICTKKSYFTKKFDLICTNYSHHRSYLRTFIDHYPHIVFRKKKNILRTLILSDFMNFMNFYEFHELYTTNFFNILCSFLSTENLHLFPYIYFSMDKFYNETSLKSWINIKKHKVLHLFNYNLMLVKYAENSKKKLIELLWNGRWKFTFKKRLINVQTLIT